MSGLLVEQKNVRGVSQVAPLIAAEGEHDGIRFVVTFEGMEIVGRTYPRLPWETDGRRAAIIFDRLWAATWAGDLDWIDP